MRVGDGRQSLIVNNVLVAASPHVTVHGPNLFCHTNDQAFLLPETQIDVEPPPDV